MLETFTVSTFSAHLGETFRLHLPTGGTLAAELIEVTALSAKSPSGTETPRKRTPFSLVFRVFTDMRLVQRIYTVEHPAIGTFPLFLVPVGVDEKGLRCEAIFT